MQTTSSSGVRSCARLPAGSCAQSRADSRERKSKSADLPQVLARMFFRTNLCLNSHSCPALAYTKMKDSGELYSSANAEGWNLSSLQEDLDAHPPPPISRINTCFVRGLPTLAMALWFGTLTAVSATSVPLHIEPVHNLTLWSLPQLLLSWALEGHKVYSSKSGAVPYISEVGYFHRTIFVTGSCATASLFVSSVAVERSLRATRVLPEVTTDRTLWHMVGITDVITGGLGGLALCGLSWYDNVHTPRVHTALTASCFSTFPSSACHGKSCSP